jgi:hypothetical protein
VTLLVGLAGVVALVAMLLQTSPTLRHGLGLTPAPTTTPETTPRPGAPTTAPPSAHPAPSRPNPTPPTTAAPLPAATPVDQVPAGIADNCSTTVDGAVNAWLASVPAGAVARFAHDGCYAQNGSFTVTDRKDLVIDGNGSTFKAVTPGTVSRVNWDVVDDSAIVLENMTIVGANPHAGIPDATSPDNYAQHGIEFASTQGGTVDNVSISDTYGDFLEARGATPQVPSRNILVENCHFDRSGRQGLGLTNVDGFTFTHSYLGDVPQAGIDVEPNGSTEYGYDITISDDTFGNTHFALFNTSGLSTAGYVGDITITGNVMVGKLSYHNETCQPTVKVQPSGDQVLSGYTVTGNSFEGYGSWLDWTRVDTSLISGNTVHFENGECRVPAGITLTDCNGIKVTGNSTSGITHQALAADDSTVIG